MNKSSLIHNITIYVIKKVKIILKLFLQKSIYFSTFNWVLKGFSKTNPFL
jgi:hypothetical protein